MCGEGMGLGMHSCHCKSSQQSSKVLSVQGPGCKSLVPMSSDEEVTVVMSRVVNDGGDYWI